MKSRIEKKARGLAWLRTSLLVLLLGPVLAHGENRPGSAAHARRPGVAERFRLDVAREVFRTQAAKFEQGLANNAEARAYLRGENSAPRPETVDAILREYTRLVTTDPAVASQVSRLTADSAVRARYQEAARREGIQMDALVAAGRAEAAAVNTLGGTTQSGAARFTEADVAFNQAMLRLAETFAERGQYLSGAFGTASRQIREIFESANAKIRLTNNPTQQAVGHQLRSLLTKAAGHPEALTEIIEQLPKLANAGPDAPRMLRGFELVVDLRDITSNGTKNGDPHKAMAKVILGAPNDAAPGVNELAGRIAANERLLQRNAAGFERAVEKLKFPEKFLPALREHLRRKDSLAEVMDAIDEMLARTSMTANERAKLLQLKDYYAAQRLLMALHLANRLHGKPKDRVVGAKCIMKAAPLTSEGAVLGAKQALAGIFALMVAGGQATAAEVAEAQSDVENFTPVSSLSETRPATAAMPPPSAGASSVATRPTHGGARP